MDEDAKFGDLVDVAVLDFEVVDRAPEIPPGNGGVLRVVRTWGISGGGGAGLDGGEADGGAEGLAEVVADFKVAGGDEGVGFFAPDRVVGCDGDGGGEAFDVEGEDARTRKFCCGCPDRFAGAHLGACGRGGV